MSGQLNKVREALGLPLHCTKDQILETLETLIDETKYEPLRNEDGSLKQFMPKIDGKSFRCQCGTNVFHHPDKTRLSIYECNGCGQWYDSE